MSITARGAPIVSGGIISGGAVSTHWNFASTRATTENSSARNSRSCSRVRAPRMANAKVFAAPSSTCAASASPASNAPRSTINPSADTTAKQSRPAA